MESVFQEKCSNTLAVRGLLDGGSVMVRRMKAFPVTNEMKPQAGDNFCVLWTQESGVPIGISYVMPRSHMFHSRVKRRIHGPKMYSGKYSLLNDIMRWRSWLGVSRCSVNGIRPWSLRRDDHTGVLIDAVDQYNTKIDLLHACRDKWQQATTDVVV